MLHRWKKTQGYQLDLNDVVDEDKGTTSIASVYGGQKFYVSGVWQEASVFTNVC